MRAPLAQFLIKVAADILMHSFYCDFPLLGRTRKSTEGIAHLMTRQTIALKLIATEHSIVSSFKIKTAKVISCRQAVRNLTRISHDLHCKVSIHGGPIVQLDGCDNVPVVGLPEADCQLALQRRGYKELTSCIRKRIQTCQRLDPLA